MAAAIQTGCLSDKDLILATPTIEELGLLRHPDTKARWDAAMKRQTDMRAQNIAKRVQSKEALQGAAETALKEQVAEVMRNLRVYFIVDISGSMEGAIPAAKEAIKKLLPAFPLEQLHVSVFSTTGREVTIRHSSAAGVENAFAGFQAGGGTDYGQGIPCFRENLRSAPRTLTRPLSSAHKLAWFDSRIGH
jgi:Mg-chelatase subunit ChlD